uniref:STING ligand-binding domain-containing protein n=1 Tax=Timema shepardi TaxID=629360 RepID=A0A7R9B5B0_TIMSH|nr:unnamed protein product [Timema shepardi]
MWNTPSLQVVREDRRGRLIFPPDLPKERGCKTQIFASLTMVVSLLGSCYLHYVLAAPSNIWESFRYVGISFSSCFVVFILGHFFIRLWKMFEEFFHLRARYEGSIMQILKETFHCNTITYFCSGCALFLMPWFWHVYGNFYKYIFKYESPLLCVLCTAFCFSHVIKMEESPLNRTLQLVQLGGLDYGSGMAYSFFYGYLQFILPNKGDSNKGLKEKIQDYVSHHKLNESLFPVKKLFILIPSSGYIATCLTKMDNKMCLEEATSLDAEKRNVAGVQARSYKNSIYKIRSPDNTELVYLAVEGATPVKTYYNVMRQDPQKGG